MRAQFLSTCLMFLTSSGFLIAVEPTQKEINQAIARLSCPCPDRSYINDFRPSRLIIGKTQTNEENYQERLMYLRRDMYNDCPAAMDLLRRTTRPIDDRLLKMASTAPDLPPRYRASKILIQRKNKRVVPILKKMAGSSDATERYLAYELYQDAIREKQLPITDDVSFALTAYPKEKKSSVRKQLIGFLGVARCRKAVPLLLNALKTKATSEVIRALGEIGDASVASILIKKYQPKKSNASSYLYALGKIGTLQAVDFLIEHLDQGRTAVEALFETRSSKALPALRKQLKKLVATKTTERVELAIIRLAIARLDNPDPREKLMAYAEDGKATTRERLHALRSMMDYDVKPYVPRLLEICKGARKAPSLQIACIRLLADQPGDKVTFALMELVLTDKAQSAESFVHIAIRHNLRETFNERLGRYFRTFEELREHLQKQ